MGLFLSAFIVLFTSLAQAQVVTQTYRGQSPDPAGPCELTLKISKQDSAEKVVGFAIKGPLQMWMGFGACENICRYPDGKEELLNEKDYVSLEFRELRADTFPQLKLVSRAPNSKTQTVTARSLEIDTDEGQPDEFRFTRDIEVGPIPTVMESMNCTHLTPVQAGH